MTSSKDGWKDRPHKPRSRASEDNLKLFKFYHIHWIRAATGSRLWTVNEVLLEWMERGESRIHKFTVQGTNEMIKYHQMQGWMPWFRLHQGK